MEWVTWFILVLTVTIKGMWIQLTNQFWLMIAHHIPLLPKYPATMGTKMNRSNTKQRGLGHISYSVAPFHSLSDGSCCSEKQVLREAKTRSKRDAVMCDVWWFLCLCCIIKQYGLYECVKYCETTHNKDTQQNALLLVLLSFSFQRDHTGTRGTGAEQKGLQFYSHRVSVQMKQAQLSLQQS